MTYRALDHVVCEAVEGSETATLCRPQAEYVPEGRERTSKRKNVTCNACQRAATAAEQAKSKKKREPEVRRRFSGQRRLAA